MEVDWNEPEFNYWWSGLKDVEDNCNWTWQASGLRANYTNWHEMATPCIYSGVNCMQMLSGTAYQGQWMTFQCSNNFITSHPLCQLPN